MTTLTLQGLARALACAMLIAVEALASTAVAEDRIRGEIVAVDSNAIDVRDERGATHRIRLTQQATILKLSPSSFAEVDFGVYVGSVAERLDDRYSPIFRDSLSWLHRSFELRVIDEALRGIALGVMQWDLTPGSIMTHGWVDDMEIRVLSIKYGPTEAEETDVEVGRDIRVLRMSLGDRNLIRPGARLFAGAVRAADGLYDPAFLMVGTDGVVPGL